MNPDEELKIKLSTEFGGMDDAARYAAALRNVANEEGNLARASRRAAKVLAESAKVKQDAIKASGSNAPGSNAPAPNYKLSRNDVMGPHTRLGLLQQKLAEATSAGADSATLADLRLKVRRTQRQIDRAGENVGTQDYESVGQAVLSSRFNAGPFQPLAGRTLRATLTPERAAALAKKVGGIPGGAGLASAIEGLAGSNAATIIGRLVAGPAGIAAASLIGLHKATSALMEEEKRKADLGVKLNNEVLANGAAFGSRGAGAGSIYSSLFGKDAGGAAFAFQNRISTDPYARMSAARLGISDLGGNFGSIDPGKKYIEAIKKLSGAEDELSRRRQARALGIEDEVEKYRLLSEASKKNIDIQSKLQDNVVDNNQKKGSAEYERSVERLKKVDELLDIQQGKPGERVLTWWNNLKASTREFQLRQELNSVSGKALAGSEKSETQKNTEATEKLNQTMQKLNKNIGETEGSRSGLGKMRGDQIFDAYLMGALQMGAF